MTGRSRTSPSARASLWRHPDFVESLVGRGGLDSRQPRSQSSRCRSSPLRCSAPVCSRSRCWPQSRCCRSCFLPCRPEPGWIAFVGDRCWWPRTSVEGWALLTIPAAYILDSLTIEQLFVVAFVTGTFSAFFDIADASYLPAILDRDDLVDGNANLQIKLLGSPRSAADSWRQT